MFPLMFRVSLSKKKLAAASSIWSLRVSLLLPSLKTSHNHYHDHHKISVSSTEIIKPSSPTPSQLNTFKLSFMDKQALPHYVPFIFFYPAPRNRGSNSKAGENFETLKSSLAQTLTRFYPLAGRLSRSGDDDNDSVTIVRCNDQGVPFSSATVDGDSSSSMAQFLKKRPEIDSLGQFLPLPADMVSEPSALESASQIAFRATAFPCGGVAIGVCFLHKIIDGPTLADFMKLCPWSQAGPALPIDEFKRAEEDSLAAVAFRFAARLLATAFGGGDHS